MSSDDLTTEPPRRAGASILTVTSRGRKFFNEVIRLCLCAINGSSASGIFLSLAVLTILIVVQSDPTPTPTPTPLPF
jgi:hypothetical protein